MCRLQGDPDGSAKGDLQRGMMRAAAADEMMGGVLGCGGRSGRAAGQEGINVGD